MCPTIHFPNVSLKIRERRLRVLENRVLRRIFGLKWEEVIGRRIKLPNESHPVL